MPLISSPVWPMESSSCSFWLSRAVLLPVNSRASPWITAPAVEGNSACMSAGNSTEGKLSRSATRRARRPSASTSWARTIRCSALIWTSSSVASTWPSRTWSPWRTDSVLTMPPSRCCTSLRFWSTLTVPTATTAPSSIAQAAQPPHPATSSAVRIIPARMRGHSRNGRSRGTSRAGTGWANSDASTCFMPCFPSGMVRGELQMVVAGKLDRHDVLGAGAVGHVDGGVFAVGKLLEAEADGLALAAVLVEVELLEQVGDLLVGVFAIADGDLVGGGHDPVADREVGDLLHGVL